MSLKVLVVDDDEIFVFLHSLLVQENGISSDPIGFENGKTAFDYLNSQDSLIDHYLILLDINMPEMNAWQFLDSIQDKPYADRVLVVIVTSSVDLEDYEKAAEYPQIIKYLEKPLDHKACKQIKSMPVIESYITS